MDPGPRTLPIPFYLLSFLLSFSVSFSFLFLRNLHNIASRKISLLSVLHLVFFLTFLHLCVDEIWVEHRVQPSPKIVEEPQIIPNYFAKQFRVLLEKGTHSDITFIVGEEKEEFNVHKAILTARSSYFKVMFRPGGMSESTLDKITIERHDKEIFRRMMEFIYTAEVSNLEECSASEIISLLEISNQYLLEELGNIAEVAACKIVNQDNIGKFMLLCATYNTMQLRDVCKSFVSLHGTKLQQVKIENFFERLFF